MERRLTRAYDHMTMPDDCARRIESRLQSELQNRKKGQYTKAISPIPNRKSYRVAAAACLLLVLIVGGTALCLGMTDAVVEIPVEDKEAYSVVTDLPAEEVEAFAAEIRQNLLDEDWTSFAKKVHYPIAILVKGNDGDADPQERVISDSSGMLGLFLSNAVSSSFLEEIRREPCTDLFCNWQGISMADGRIWINERNGKLKITAINGVFTEEHKERVPKKFTEILSGKPAEYIGNRGEMTVQEYCAALWGGDVSVNAFTVVDMDDNGACELVFSAQDADGVVGGYLVLRVDGTKICAYTLRGRDLRKDGTFYSYTANGDARLRFQDAVAYTIEPTDFSLQDKPLAQWHIYPCQLPEGVLQSYEHASQTGFSTYPGNYFSYFGLLAYGMMENSWDMVQQYMTREGTLTETAGSFTAVDPDAPGCWIYGELTGEQGQRKISKLGYYACSEDTELWTEITGLDQEEPRYWVEVTLDSPGREVDTPEEVLEYFGQDPFRNGINRDAQQIVDLLNSFVRYYAANDMEKMAEHMAQTAAPLSSYPFAGNVEVMAYGILPEELLSDGDKWHTSLELQESENNYHLSVELMKEKNGWKIQSYGLEKQ